MELIARAAELRRYPVGRIDRMIQGSLDRGDVLASASRRARRYELSGPGLAKAFNLGHELGQIFQDHPNPQRN